MAKRPSRGFSKTLDATRRQRKNDPAAKAAKAELRQQVLNAIGPTRARVFDAFAGAGEMYRMVWHQAAAYVGCDRDWFPDNRIAYVADNRRVMRCIDLPAFNVFDFDAHGSPWEQAIILAARRSVAPGEQIGLVLTDGSNLDLSLGGMAAPLREIAGFVGIPAGAARSHGEIIERAINGLCRRMHVAVLRRWDASGASSAKVRHVGLLLESIEIP
jgi:hypothetical protein